MNFFIRQKKGKNFQNISSEFAFGDALLSIRNQIPILQYRVCAKMLQY
jgi:hypothetical protein